MTLLERVVVPVATERDAVEAATALSPYLDGIQRITAVHVIEKGGGAVDKAPMEKRRADALVALSAVESLLAEEVTVETRIEFGTDVAETIVGAALDADATAIAFRPRGANRLVRWLSGDTATRLVTNARVPVVSLRTEATAAPSPKREPGADDAEVGG